MASIRVKEVFFLPPLAIARVGASGTPLECFVWDSDRTIHGAHRTVIRPRVSLDVLADGSLRPYLPRSIQFRDQGKLRPVAPFFELWVMLEGRDEPHPLTSALLEQLDATIDNVEYTITVANRKAHRRTGFASCAYIASVTVGASDHESKQLLAYSPHTSGQQPLVLESHKIPLGHFQAIKPIHRRAMGVHLGTLRVRFTPATGQVYGPPTAIAAPASPLRQGIQLPNVTLGGRQHEIVPKENRILNPDTPWSRHIMDVDGDDPQPSDSYDGANVGDSRSWGVVDDTCDGIIEANVVINNLRHVATARILSTCPDYAPDRRPFYSIADDLADRDLPAVAVSEDAELLHSTQYEIADLFERAFETLSLYNLDAMRMRAILENLEFGSDDEFHPKLPKTDHKSMTDADRGLPRSDIHVPPYADLTADLFPFPAPKADRPPGFRLPYAAAAQFAHAKLCDVETLLDFLRSKPERVKALVRPPFGRFSQYSEKDLAKSNPKFRDPRLDRDITHDMRMPPYMRDSDLNPLSLTNRQYDALMDLVDLLVTSPETPSTQMVADYLARQTAIEGLAEINTNAVGQDIKPRHRRRKAKRKRK